MVIKTTYKIGDEVWYMNGSQAVSGKITSMSIYVTETKKLYAARCFIQGLVDKWGNGDYRMCYNLYKTKQELLDSL